MVVEPFRCSSLVWPGRAPPTGATIADVKITRRTVRHPTPEHKLAKCNGWRALPFDLSSSGSGIVVRGAAGHSEVLRRTGSEMWGLNPTPMGSVKQWRGRGPARSTILKQVFNELASKLPPLPHPTGCASGGGVRASGVPAVIVCQLHGVDFGSAPGARLLPGFSCPGLCSVLLNSKPSLCDALMA